MAVTMRSNGLHHAVSLGTFEVGSKSSSKRQQIERSYDSDDENMSRRRFRHTSPSEIYARPSVYSKGDIREQYCLTDRQVHSIERSRRDRFFGCLSRRATPKSFLGVCVGRRAPSDENLNSYAPFYRYPRYPHQMDKNSDSDLDNSYFRRQPASILSSSKINTDVSLTSSNAGNAYAWVGGVVPQANQAANTFQQQQTDNNMTNYANEQSTTWLAKPIDYCYQDMFLMNCLELQHNNAAVKHVEPFSNQNCCSYQYPSTALVGLTAASQAHLGPTAPRTKHVSFARSHTLASFDDMNISKPSPARINGARSQERLLGGKKAILGTPSPASAYMSLLPAQAVIQQPCASHMHQHQQHSHQHHHTPIHIHPYVSAYSADVQVGQPLPTGVNIVSPCPLSQNMRSASPEIVVIEKKFRNSMKTQATQTEIRKDGLPNMLVLSPRTVQKVKVVSQSAQTNGLQNGKKLTKSLSEMPNGSSELRNLDAAMGTIDYQDHEILQRTQSEEPPRSPLEVFGTYLDKQSNIAYYQPPPSLHLDEYGAHSSNIQHCYAKNEEHAVDVHTPTLIFDFESNSLPRRTCSFHRMDSAEYNSNSLPRTEPLQSYEACKHITECSELMTNTDSTQFDFSRSPLLSPPSQYCKSEEEDYNPQQSSQGMSTEIDASPCHRRMSLIPLTKNEPDNPFKRDDIRRQSMPVFVKTEKLIDGQGLRSSFRSKYRIKTIIAEPSEEKEIFIDFKPNLLLEPLQKTKKPHISPPKIENTLETQYVNEAPEECEECASLAAALQHEGIDSDDEKEDPVYENVPITINQPIDNLSCIDEEAKHIQYRKRLESVEEPQEEEEKITLISGPPSPYQEEILANASTFPSSDSLANDTRDHSDGIWNESQVTVLTAENKENSDNGTYSSNMLLTPSSRRKHLLLVHQQRSSIDTDVFDLEEGFAEHSLTYSNTLKPIPSPSIQPSTIPKTEEPTTYVMPTKIGAPSIAVTHSSIDLQEPRSFLPDNSLMGNRICSRTLPSSPLEVRRADFSLHRNSDTPSIYLVRSDYDRDRSRFNADASECSTNTDDYGTCTDNSKRTPGIKTPPTTTSSSSATHVPVSTQTSQMDKTHEGSSFESASSLYSTRGEFSMEELQEDKLLKAHGQSDSIGIPKRSPSPSISSVSSGSSNVAALLANPVRDEIKATEDKPTQQSGTKTLIKREKPKIKPESISDDDHSDLRYSSSGYYESPRHEDYNTCRSTNRRTRFEEERKRKKTSMKLNIEKENMRALTSPLKKAQSALQEKSPERNFTKLPQHVIEIISPNRMKRIRPKVRRQLRKTPTKDENSARRVQNIEVHGPPGPTHEKLLDISIQQNKKEECIDAIKPISDCVQLKAKSIESLRSVSPGSDSVFYSEADGTGKDQHGHCLHCGKEMEGLNFVNSAQPGDSAESIPCIVNDLEQNIVKPPSDFADSPTATKTTQRLYKKMDKRFRSEDRYHGERGRHFKTRQENIRAKSEERNKENQLRSTQNLRAIGSSPSVLPDVNFEHNQQIIYRGHYKPGRYCRLTDTDVWTQLNHQCFERQRGRSASTESEKSFHSKYQVILHRLVQRRCTLEMYQRQKNNTFRVDKTVLVKSDSGEFGFRIHGSKPVVVAAIEPDTPAESSGLEVGDILISVNGVQVLEKHHTEVVKIAHDGCETLELKVARTIGVLMNEQQEQPCQPILSGYLWRQSGQAKGVPDAKKWVRRWFCLRPDNCLYYYKTENDNQPVGALILAKHSIELCPPEIGKPFAFKVDSGEGIPLYVAADSEELTNRWITLLKQCAVDGNPWLDKCARNLYQPPGSIVRPDCFGHLLKLGSRWCGWSKRYCVLKDACIYFYQDAKSKSAFGMACLHGYKVASMSTNSSGKKNSFEIIPPDSKMRHYYFSTESDMDKKRWISALEYSIDRWIKAG